MIAELKSVYSPDLDCALDNFSPQAPESADYFELTINAMIGPLGEEKSELFQIQICTPKWLQSRCDQGEVITGRHMIIVRDFNFIQIQEYIKNLCIMCSGNDWSEVAFKLSRYGYWEFEDYKQ